MGFLKNIIKILPVILLLFVACGEQPIIIKYFKIDGPGIKMFGSCNERNFYVNEDLGDSLQLIWQQETTGSYGNFSPVILDDYILVGDLSGNLTSFNRLTGKKNGAVEEKGEIAVSPVIVKYKVFFVLNELREENSILYSYDLMRGKILSEEYFEGVSNNEIIYADDMLYVLTVDGVLHKFNDVGYPVDKIDTKVMVQADPAAHGDFIYWGNQKGEIISVNKNTMKINYRKKISDAFEAGITISRETGFIGDVDGNVFSINLQNGEVIWKYKTKAKIRGFVAYDNNAVYIGNLAGSFYALNKFNGDLIFKTVSEGLFNTAPLVFNDYVVQPNLNEKVLIIDKRTGEIKKNIEFERRVKMTPVFYDGIIYFGADRGQVYALKPVKDNL